MFKDYGSHTRIRCFLGRARSALVVMLLLFTQVCEANPGSSDDGSQRAQIERILGLSGDRDAVEAEMTAWKQLALGVVRSLNEPALPAVRSALDQYVSSERSAQAILEHFKVLNPAALNEVEAWARTPNARRINELLFLPTEPPPPFDADSVSAERLTLVTGLLDAMSLRLRANSLGSQYYQTVVLMLKAVDPENIRQIDRERAAFGPGNRSNSELIWEWMLPALQTVSDEDLATQLQFAESRSGKFYFLRAASVLVGPEGDRWREPLIEIIGAHGRLVAAPMSDEQVSESLARVKYLLDEVGLKSGLREALILLRAANQARPDNVEILSLLGETLIYATNGPSPNILEGELRSPLVEQGMYAEAERFLARAIELDPTQHQAYVFLGYAKFQYGQDDEALTLYQKAVELNSDEPWLDINLADLLQSTGDVQGAIGLYGQVLDAPERSPGVHYAALSRGRIAFIAANLADQYTRLAWAYLDRYPDNWSARLLLAHHLLDLGEALDRAYEVASKVPPGWQDSWKSSLLARASLLQAVTLNGQGPGITPAAMRKLDQAIGFYTSAGRLVYALREYSDVTNGLMLVIRAKELSSKHATALLHAKLIQSEYDYLPELVELGAALDQRDDLLGSEPPLNYAALRRDPALFDLLLKLGAKPNQPFRSGRSVREFLNAWESTPGGTAILEILDKWEADAAARGS